MASQDTIQAKLLLSLENTPYACKELTPLSGGFVNFTYRGQLVKPLVTATSPITSIVLKHAEPYLAVLPTAALTTNRSYYEYLVLEALHSLDTTIFQNIHVLTLPAHLYIAETDTIILSDFPNSTDLYKYITTHELSPDQISRLGTALGKWTRDFHAWGSAPEQNALREKIKGNGEMAGMKHNITYGQLDKKMGMFPSILERDRSVLESLEAQRRGELEVGAGKQFLTHGDFKFANVLLPHGDLPSQSTPLDLWLIDWELSHLGSPTSDLSQMLADLYFLSHFDANPVGIEMISAFLTGYGALDDGLAFRFAVDFGVYLVVAPGRAEEGEKLEKCMELGREIIVHALGEDKSWFEGGVLSRTFFPGA